MKIIAHDLFPTNPKQLKSKSLQPFTCFHHPVSDGDDFDTCASIPRLLRGGSTTVVGGTRQDANPTPNTHKGAWWRDETTEGGHCVPPIDPAGS